MNRAHDVGGMDGFGPVVPETMLMERDLVSDDEIASGHPLHAAKPVARVLKAAKVAPTLGRG